jgi:hypothetical protein
MTEITFGDSSINIVKIHDRTLIGENSNNHRLQQNSFGIAI